MSVKSNQLSDKKRGRPATAHALTNAERQALHRQKKRGGVEVLPVGRPPILKTAVDGDVMALIAELSKLTAPDVWSTVCASHRWALQDLAIDIDSARQAAELRFLI
jgi:hypothetical protein